MNLGDIYLDLDKPAKALRYYHQAEEYFPKQVRADPVGYYMCYFGMGKAYLQLGEIEKGLKYLESSLENRRKIFHDDHPWLAEVLKELATAYKGRDGEQAQFYSSWAERVENNEVISPFSEGDI